MKLENRACLHVFPLRGVKRMGVKGQLAPRFVGPYRVLERMREVAYKLSYPKDCQEFKMCFTFPS